MHDLKSESPWVIEFRNDWKQPFGKWNWIDLTFIEVSIMRDYSFPGIEFNLMLLGIGVYIRYNFPWDTPEAQELLTSLQAEKDESVPPENLQPLIPEYKPA